MSAYEKLRQQNLDDNRRILAEIGLSNPFRKLPGVKLKKGNFKRKAENDENDYERARPKKMFAVEDLDSSGSLRGSRRRSARICGKDVPTEEELKEEVEKWEEENDTPKRVPAHRPNFYGAVPDVEIGTFWLTRMEACRAGIHRPTVAGIHGGPDGAYSIALSGGYDDNIDLGEGFTYTGEGPPVSGIHGGPDGAYSIALSGGYDDNIDLGEGFTYTGEGGRDLKGTSSNPKNLRTAPQSKDQELTRGNLALSKSVETGNPVRVIRGYKLDSPFAPEEGYRYDGLYRVEKYWYGTGLSGFGVWRFALRRLENQAPPPWTYTEEDEGSPSKKRTEKSDDSEEETVKSDSGFDSESVTSSQMSETSSTAKDDETKSETTDTMKTSNDDKDQLDADKKTEGSKIKKTNKEDGNDKDNDKMADSNDKMADTNGEKAAKDEKDDRESNSSGEVVDR